MVIQVCRVDFAILYIGRFSGISNIPEFPPAKGPETFHGMVVHSMEYTDMDFAAAQVLVRGKRVTVVRFQKHAMDIAMECSTENAHSLKVIPTHRARSYRFWGGKSMYYISYRNEHWNISNYLPWGVPSAYFYFDHFSELLVHKPGEGFFLGLLAALLSPLRWGFSKFVGGLINRKHCLSKLGMVPKHSFLKETGSCLVSIVPEGFYEAVDKGSIKFKKAPSFGFCKEGILIVVRLDLQRLIWSYLLLESKILLFVKENAHRNCPPLTEFVDIDWVFGMHSSLNSKTSDNRILRDHFKSCTIRR
ncbi:probable flavin-containing monooxygenase 1 [Rhododendron vialii]|uniref:probable flavin-containing monooxygenase 1 n=1 Tax=Rhododendron vialii TaxID=182163 RepID=UPI00265EE319|nr:probable flavin-containing monooxygenase 1 [Rhododendron vialii]